MHVEDFGKSQCCITVSCWYRSVHIFRSHLCLDLIFNLDLLLSHLSRFGDIHCLAHQLLKVFIFFTASSAPSVHVCQYADVSSQMDIAFGCKVHDVAPRRLDSYCFLVNFPSPCIAAARPRMLKRLVRVCVAGTTNNTLAHFEI